MGVGDPAAAAGRALTTDRRPVAPSPPPVMQVRAQRLNPAVRCQCARGASCPPRPRCPSPLPQFPYPFYQNFFLAGISLSNTFPNLTLHPSLTGPLCSSPTSSPAVLYTAPPYLLLPPPSITCDIRLWKFLHKPDPHSRQTQPQKPPPLSSLSAFALFPQQPRNRPRAGPPPPASKAVLRVLSPRSRFRCVPIFYQNFPWTSY